MGVLKKNETTVNLETKETLESTRLSTLFVPFDKVAKVAQLNLEQTLGTRSVTNTY